MGALQCRIASIWRFLSNLSWKCKPFSKLMKMDASFTWNAGYQQAFDNIKAYLTKPHVLTSLVKGQPLVLYITVLQHSLGALQTQENEEEKEIYYLSRTFVGPQVRYSLFEKVCLVLIFAIQKWRHYLRHHRTKLILKVDPLKYYSLPAHLLMGKLIDNPFLGDPPHRDMNFLWKLWVAVGHRAF